MDQYDTINAFHTCYNIPHNGEVLIQLIYEILKLRFALNCGMVVFYCIYFHWYYSTRDIHYLLNYWKKRIVSSSSPHTYLSSTQWTINIHALWVVFTEQYSVNNKHCNHWTLFTVSSTQWTIVTMSSTHWTILTVRSTHWTILTVCSAHWTILTVCSAHWTILTEHYSLWVVLTMSSTH